MESELRASQLIRDIPNFPEKGVIFRDITPVLRDPEAFAEVVDKMVSFANSISPDVVVGIESRGFLLGAPVAIKIGKGFVPVRKIGKLPHETVSCEYDLEYGTSAVEMHKDAISKGERVLIVDDLLATGGTSSAAAQLVEELGGEVAGVVFLIELESFNGRSLLKKYNVCSFVKY